MTDSRLEAARWRVGCQYWWGKSQSLGVHTVTFQPRETAINQDRLVVEKWDIGGDRWLFLAALDGHFGPVTVEYTATSLPGAIRRKLRSFVHDSLGGRLSRKNVNDCESAVTDLLKKEIESFDKAIGDALKEICPKPEQLTEREARLLIEEHKDILARAFEGTTLAFALVNVDQHFMWAASVGDSTVALSTTGPDGKRQAERLCELHSFKNPHEYYRATMSHTHHEQPLLDWEDRILGWLSVARAIGDFALKFDAAYLANLFRYMPYHYTPPIASYASKIVTPPYIIAEPCVRFIDLHDVWGKQNKLILFTDGVDNLVDGHIVFTPEKHSGANPVEVVSALLAEEVDPSVAQVLGHEIEPRWSRDVNNLALDVLGNLLGGRNAERLEMVMDQKRLRDTGEGWPFHIDDTSIIVWGLSDADA